MLQTLLNATNNKDESGKDNSHIVPIPSGNSNLSDVLGQMNGDMPGAAPSMDLDPELAWAMELSKQTFAAETKQSTSTSSSSSSKPADTSGEKDVEMKDTEEAIPNFSDDPELQAALQMSLGSGQVTFGQDKDMDMDREQLDLAIQMSVATAVEDKKRDETKKDDKEEKKEEKPKEKKEEKKEEKPEEKKENKKEEKHEGKKEDTTNMEVDPTAIDPSFLASVVLELPNVDINDPEVQSLLHSLNKDKDKDKK